MERVVIVKTWEHASASDCLLGEAISIALLNHENILEFVLDSRVPRLRHGPDKLLQLSKSFSSGEQLLVRVALDIWSGSGDAKIAQLIENLDEDNLYNVLNGLYFLLTQKNDNKKSSHFLKLSDN